LADRVKVTIGVCVKNAEATIKEAIDSVLNQDFPHELMELIVVDGYSGDKTLSIIKENLKNTDIRSKIFCENKGLGYARQIVVDNAEGKYIVWVDGDMVLPRDYVSKQVEFMERNPKMGIAKGRYGIRKGSSLVATLEDLEFLLSFRCEGEVSSRPLATSGCIYRIKAIRQVGGFDENIKGVGEDMDAEYRVRAAGWLLCITPAIFYEKRRETWKSLWDEYFWHGRGGYRLLEKDVRIINFYKMWPPVALATKLLHIPAAYRLARRKVVLLLPLHYIFKRIAWFLGFVKSWLEKSYLPG